MLCLPMIECRQILANDHRSSNYSAFMKKVKIIKDKIIKNVLIE